MTHKMFEEVEYYFKTYDKYRANQKVNDKRYKFNNYKNQELLDDLLKFKKLIKQDRAFPVIKIDTDKQTKAYINTDVGHRLLLSDKNLLKNKKYLPKKFIIDTVFIKYKKLFLQLLMKLEKIYDTKYFNYMYLDIKSYYLSLNLEIVNTAIDFLSKKKFGKITNLANKIKIQLDKNRNELFIDGKSGFYLGNYINKLLSYFVGLYIAYKIDSKVVVFFEDDFLFLYKKDKRLDLNKKYNKIIEILGDTGFRTNLEKINIGRFKKDELLFLGFSFKNNKIYVSESKIAEKKYKLVGIISTMKVIDNKIINKLNLFKKIRNSLYGFKNYYKFATNIKVVLEDLYLFIKKSLRYSFYKIT